MRAVKLSRSTHTRITLTVAVVVALAWLPLRGQQHHNLDAYDNATLDRDLEGELDDIYEDLNPDALAPVSEIHADMIDALQDDGDDADEDDIDFEDLEDEVEEDGVTIDQVIDRGLQQADRLASARGAMTWVLARLPAPPQRVDSRTTPRLAVRQVKGSFIMAIRDVRRE
jgi:hypothetical protein